MVFIFKTKQLEKEKEKQKRVNIPKIEEYSVQTKYDNCPVFKIEDEISFKTYLAIDIVIKDNTIKFYDVERDRVVTLFNTSVTINEYRQ